MEFPQVSSVAFTFDSPINSVNPSVPSISSLSHQPPHSRTITSESVLSKLAPIPSITLPTLQQSLMISKHTLLRSVRDGTLAIRRASRDVITDSSSKAYALKRGIAKHASRALNLLAHYMESLSKDPSIPNDTRNKSNNGINLSGNPGPFFRSATFLRDSPRLSLEEKIAMYRRNASARKANIAMYKALMQNHRKPTVTKKRSPEIQEMLPMSELYIDPTLSPTIRKTLLVLAKMQEANREQRRRSKEMSMTEEERKEQECKDALRKAFDDRYKLMLSRKEKEQRERELREKEDAALTEGERRKRRWLTILPRTEDGQLIAYGCGRRRKDWEVAWRKRSTPPVCGKRRREENDAGEERQPQRRRF